MGFRETFSVASADVAGTFKKLDVGAFTRRVSVHATTTDATGSEAATIRFVLVDESIGGGKVVGFQDITATSGTVRTGMDGTDGDYLCSMSAAVVDLAGAGGSRSWWVGVSAKTPDDLTVYINNVAKG